jgi:hypothetical protein
MITKKMTVREFRTLELMRKASLAQDEKRRAKTRLRNKPFLEERIKHYQKLLDGSLEKLDDAKDAFEAAEEASKLANARHSDDADAKAANEAYVKARAAVEAAEAERTKYESALNRMIDFSKVDHEVDYAKARAADADARNKARTAYREMHRSGVNLTSSEVRTLAIKLGFPTDHNLAVK